MRYATWLTLMGILAGGIGPQLLLAQPAARSGYQVAWFDEFNTTSLNTSLWTAANTNITTNNSLQDYLPQQVTVTGGNMVITSENVPSRGRPYRSGLVTSTASQKHGRWDIRANLPTSTGMWPAIWLLADAPWPSQGEIDIMENRGNEPTITNSAFHYGTNPPFLHNFRDTSQTSLHNGAIVNYHNSFHTYSVEWDPNQVRFYVDDVHHWTVRDSDTAGFLSNNVGNMRLIINTAVGGDYLQNPNASTVWPQKFEVDYVHAYSRLAGQTVLSFENGGFEAQGGSLADWSRFGSAANNVSSGNEHVASGSESLKLYGQFNGETNYSGIEQGITVAAGDRLTAFADAFVAANDSIAGSGNRVELKIDYYNEQYGMFGSAQYIRSDFIVLADGNSLNNVWLNGQLTSTAPAGAVEARLALAFRQVGNAAGAVHIDNVRFLVAVPEPSALLIGTVGAMVLGIRRRRAK